MGILKHWVLIGALSSSLLVGCGAARQLQTAQDTFVKARDAGAETKAPVEFYSAESYLKLAEHEHAEMDLSQTKVYADESTKHSEAALKKIQGGGK